MPRFLYRNTYIIFILDILLVTLSWYIAHLLRFNFAIPENNLVLLMHILPVIIFIKILCFYFFDLYQGMWRYTSLTDLLDIVKAVILSSLIIALLPLFANRAAGFSRSVFILDWVLTFFLISGLRAGIRLYFWFKVGDDRTRDESRGKRLLIIGAGDAGEKICREIHDNPFIGYRIMGFIDDEPLKINRKIHGIPVLGNRNQIKYFAEQTGAEELLIAMPSISSKDMRDIVALCKETGIPFKTVPGMGELIDGKVTVKAIRDVSYNDLLGREPVKLDEEQIGRYLKGKRLLITGAGGSIGSELCRQVCRYSPEAVVLYERAESPLYEIELELKENFQYIRIVPRLADILDIRQLKTVFDEERPHVVFHAAAYKHVPMLELNPWEAMRNNVIGTRNVIGAARDFKVERFVFVSTDKAVRPVNVMGASKRIAELLVQAQNGRGLSDTRFITVRFGNVVGSIGSVVPLFKRQIEKGGPVTVTHPDMTRYFMTIPEACQLILQAGSMGEGGEIFILEMGVPIKIADMAKDLIRLSGFEPNVDIDIKYIGLRPGEKLVEELITDGEGIVETSHKKIMVLKGQTCEIESLNRSMDEIMELAVKEDGEGIKRILKLQVPEYTPQEKGN
jgi:FlaA1/EpsC-like NDP-sugar epimerase